MAKTREVPCIYYQYEGGCEKGRDGTFRKACQTCKKYTPKKNAIPARQNLKRKKKEQLREQDMKEMMRDY